MAHCRRMVALLCAVALVTAASGYTVDCNQEYTDCETELSKLTSDDEETPLPNLFSNLEKSHSDVVTSESPPTTTTRRPETTTEIIESRTEESTTERHQDLKTGIPEEMTKPRARLLFTNTDDLQNFANALHNRSLPTDKKRDSIDLSDVNLDGDEDDEPVKLTGQMHKNKDINDKFFSNLQAPFNPMLVGVSDVEDEAETCKENDLTYKVGEKFDRGCDESCECNAGGILDCSPRCKHPYIRRGRRLNDPLCFESPVDECCSIVACATGNDGKVIKMDFCRYANDTYPVGAKWFVGCEQACTCEHNSIVTCKPRCNILKPSENCINVQDPNDGCCEIQICDVSHDVHEEPENITSSSTSTTTSTTTTSTTTEITTMIHDLEQIKSEQELLTREHKSTMRPLVLAEPIGSVKVLQNNSVQVNLIHANTSQDPIHLQLSSDGGNTYQDTELIFDNLILNLEGGKDYVIKTKETGTKFNFTITTTNNNQNEVPVEELMHVENKIGCMQDGKFYAVGEEFHIGCTELCECTGDNTRDCAALVCPSHVGLELMSKSCVRWAPSPPAEPPNCCPRAARCLSDGTCYYKGVPIPNWTEVPIAVSGCERRCFCENGELDCTDACSALPPVPPQTLRCPPLHRPGHVNISDEDCCKQWGCIPIAGKTNKTYETFVKKFGETFIYVTPMTPVLPTITPVLVKPQDTTESTNFNEHIPRSSVPTTKETSKDIDTTPYSNTTVNNNPTDTTTSYNDNPDSRIEINRLKSYIAKDEIVTEKNNIDENENAPIKINMNFPDYNFVLSNHKTPNHIEQTQTNHPFPSKYNYVNSSPIKIIKAPAAKPGTKQDGNYFIPARELFRDLLAKPALITPKVIHTYVDPTVQNHPNNSYSWYNNDDDSSPLHLSPHTELYNFNNNDMKSVINKDKNVQSSDNNVLMPGETKLQVMKMVPNPYQTVFFRYQPNPKPDKNVMINENTKIHNRPYSSLDADHFLSQMDISSEVNRNMGRSAEKTNQAVRAGPMTTNFPTHQSLPAFLPTVPPEIHFPQDDIADYDQNNIHRPLDRLPGGIPIPPYGDDNKKLSVLSMQADSPTSVKMLFGLPPVLVGLRGSVDLRYTDQGDDDISTWHSQVFAPTDEVLTTPRLEFTLSGLKPSTTYKIRGKLFLHNLPVEPESEIRIVRTLDPPTPTPPEEKRREVDANLAVTEVNDTVAHLTWRHFTEDELQLIDGIQVRYRPIGTPIYSMTELLHHGRSSAELHDLRSGTRYEASLVLVPPPRGGTELHDPGRVEFTTTPYVDPYNWTVTIEARAVGSEAAELTWRGVPSPAERWVRVYRAAHACGATATSVRREHDAFRLAARDLPPTVTLTGLEPNTRCRVWLELFLTNGKVKTSNVIELSTKSLDSPEPIDNEIESASIAGSRTGNHGDYYSALVVVGVVAALGALTSLLLLLVVVRRHHTRSVAITPTPTAPRESSLPPYDNPAYKLELQQETMDL